MRLSRNMRQIATASLVCSALIAGGYAPALANNDNHRHHWWEYLYSQVENLARGLGNLGTRLTGRLDYLTKRVDELAAQVAGQANTSLAAKIDQVASDLAQLGVKLDTNVNSLNAKIDSSVAGLNASMAGFNAGVAAVNTRIDNLSADRNGRPECATVRVARLEDTRATSGGLSVVDAGGARLGDFVGFVPTYTPLVGMSTQNRSFVLRVTDHGLRGDLVFFSADNCQGTAYVAPIFDNGDQKKTVSLAGIKKNVQTNAYTVYVTDANQPLNMAGFEVLSVAQNGSGCENLTDPNTGLPAPSNTGPALPAMVQMDLPDTGPYRVN